jgi:hypothetical protein
MKEYLKNDNMAMTVVIAKNANMNLFDWAGTFSFLLSNEPMK